MQFKDSGFGSYYLSVKILLEFLDFEALATRPDRFIRLTEEPLDLLELPFFSEFFLIFDCSTDLTDFEL